MAGPSPPATDGKPIFPDMDIPCPHCGYNLRGIVEPRCPECGREFDSDQLLRLWVRCEMPPPPLHWIVWNIYRHPVTFWQAPGIRFGQSPNFRSVLGDCPSNS